ncbi:hypothetical protein AB751O23_BB_00110 [Chlamydiales bacterium SCGC AB-751-O23]|jgi:hypothetical protein|nr:hypothetical protein AB751O23_BB_00110 [Chlamydiales bacterium SCGC AB-751-O23]
MFTTLSPVSFKKVNISISQYIPEIVKKNKVVTIALLALGAISLLYAKSCFLNSKPPKFTRGELLLKVMPAREQAKKENYPEAKKLYFEIANLEKKDIPKDSLDLYIEAQNQYASACYMERSKEGLAEAKKFLYKIASLEKERVPEAAKVHYATAIFNYALLLQKETGEYNTTEAKRFHLKFISLDKKDIPRNCIEKYNALKEKYKRT